MKKIETNVSKKIYWQKTEVEEIQETDPWEWNVIQIISDNPKQKWLGMGRTFTESSCYNIHLLSAEKQKELLDFYFSSNGLNYNWGRISIASNDFSLAPYEYLEDTNLQNFSIAHDQELILPIIKKALNYQNLTLVASPWSPPKFMKDNKSLENGGKLLPEFYALYAKYLMQFLKEYQKENIKIDFITMQNEPLANQRWESCTYSIEEQKTFIYQYLIPSLKKQKTKILVWDHNKENLPFVANNLLKKNKKIAGIGYHWYTGTHSENLEYVRQKYPKCLLVHTEGCCGFSEYDELSWLRDSELLLIDLLEDINHGTNAYIDWNLVLDNQGGPNWQNNNCKSPIILNQNKDDFILTAIYYYFGHISRYLKPNSIIYPLDKYRQDLFGIAFKSEKKFGITLLNPNDYEIDIDVLLSGRRIHDKMNPHTIITYLE